MDNKLIEFDENVENNPEVIFRSANPKIFVEAMLINSSARDSLDNNPFDRALKEVQLKDDPFEMKKTKVAVQSQPSSIQTAKLIDFGTEQLMATILEDILPSAIKEEEIESDVKIEKEPETDNSIPASTHVCPTKALNYALINHQNLKAIRSPYFGKKVVDSKPSLTRIMSDPGVSKSPSLTKRCQYQEPNHSLGSTGSLASLKSNLTKLMETEGMSFSEEARKITNQLMMSNAFSDSSSWTLSGNLSFEDLQSTKPPKFLDTDVSDIEADLQCLKIPMLDEIKHIEEQHRIEEEKENEKKTMLDNYNTLKANAEIQQLRLEHEAVDSALKTQTNVDVRRFMDILARYKNSQLSKDELLAEIEHELEFETEGDVTISVAKPERQLTFNVEEKEEEDYRERIVRQATFDIEPDLEETADTHNQTLTSDLEVRFQQQMKELFETAMLLRNTESDPSQIDLNTLFVPGRHSGRRSVVSSTPILTPAITKSSRLSVNPTARSKIISPMPKRQSQMTLRPITQKPLASSFRPIKLKTSPTRALAPAKRANPPMIAVHPVPRSRSSTCTPAIETPKSKSRISTVMTPRPTRATSEMGRTDGGRRRSLTAGSAVTKVDHSKTQMATPARKMAATPLINRLQPTPRVSYSAYQAVGTPSSRRSVLQSTSQPSPTPSRRSVLPNNSGPRNLMSQLTPKPMRKLPPFSALQKNRKD